MESFEALLQNQEPVKVIDTAIDYKDYITLDLSESNTILKTIDSGTAVTFENYVLNYLSQNNAKAAYGGYNEKRNLYKRSTIFKDVVSEERNIHIGLDIWLNAGAPVLAALDGIIHSFNNNCGLGNYGPTIILEHTIETTKFYTLYGHLSLASIANLEIGQVFKKQQIVGHLGDAAVNGDYAPHLHFQIIRNIGKFFGDYPGVCSASDLAFYLVNCPDPNLLLKIKQP